MACVRWRKNDLVFIHVEATDEAGHMGDWKAKIQALEILTKRSSAQC